MTHIGAAALILKLVFICIISVVCGAAVRELQEYKNVGSDYYLDLIVTALVTVLLSLLTI